MSGHCRITPDGSPSGLVSEPAGEFAPVIGRIETLVGSCTVSRSGSPAVAIKIGDLVGPSDVIETSAGGRLSIRFADGTAFTLSDSARMALKDYVGDETSAIFNIDRGTFSFIAGKMAEAGRLGIQTPFANIRARRNGGGIGMLSLISLFFAAFEEAQAAPPDIAFLDDGKITSKDLGQYGVVELLIKATATTPEQVKFLDDPGETIVIRASGSSVSVDSVTNSIAQMAQYQAAQQEALHTFTVGLQGQGPTGNGPGGSSTPPPPEFTPPPQNINFIPNNNPPPVFTPPPGPGTTQQNNVTDPPPQGPPPPPPPPPAPGLVVELENQTGSPSSDTTTGTLSAPGISAGVPTFVWSNGVLTPGDQSNLAAVSTLSFTGSSPNDFTFHIPDQAVDFLAAGETLTVTYNVTVAGGGTQQAIVTVFGTQDKPKLVADASGPHTTAELPNDKNDSALDHTAPGTLTFTDVDLNDTHTVSSSLVSAAWSAGGSLPSGLSTTLATSLSLTLHDSTPSQTGVGSIDFTFSAADKNFDFLADGETLTVTYNVTVTDNFGASSTQAVIVTITGSEDAPVITSGAQSGSAIEIGDNVSGENTDIHHSSGTVTFNDVDLSDIETQSITNTQVSAVLAHGYALTVAQQNTLVNAFGIDPATHSNVTGDGTIAWHYDIADSALDFLGADDVVTLTYTVQVADGHGGTASQNVTITVHGTEDAPTITSGVQAGSATEIGDNVSGENTDIHHSSGAVTFNDVDLSDIETSSSTLKQLSATLANSYSLTSAQHDALVNAFTIGAASHSNVTGNGSISWHYDIADSDLDFLGANDVVTLTFTVTTNDGHGGTASQDVTITVHGTEDAPTIDSDLQAGSATEIGDLQPGENIDIHHSSGTVTFTDVDLSDIETQSIANTQVSAALAHGYALTAAQQDALVNAFTIEAATHSQADGTGTIAWHYDIADNDLDFLGANDVVTLTFTVQVADGHGGTASQDVTITVHGTEDAPTIDSDVQAGSAIEIGDNVSGENTDIHHSSGAVTFTDVDLSDIETQLITNTQVSATLAHGYALTVAQQNSLVNAFTLDAATHSQADGTGTIGWHYDIADSALDFLGADDVVTLTYTVQVADGHGGTASQDVTITVHGTEDAPTITSGAQAGSATEIGDNVSGENTDIHHSSGAVTFNDVDLSDLETSSIANTQVSAVLAHSYALTAAQQNALVSAFTIGAASHSNITGNGSISWHYDIADSALDFLGANDVVTLTYTVQVSDGHGGTASQDVAITVHGTEDKPVITSGAQSGSATEIGDLQPGENTDIHHSSGTVTFQDVDLSDSETSSSTLKQLSATLANSYVLTSAQHDALVNAFTVDAATHSSVTGNGIINWHYDIADSDLDFLGAHDQVVLTFTVKVDDGNGGTASQDVTVTVHGSEDKPTIAATSNSFSELAGTNNPNTDSVGGTISFTDVDASDRPTVSAPFDHYSYIAADGTTALTLTPAQQTDLEKALVIVPAASNTDNGSATWTYSVADKALDFLAQGETLTFTYIGTVDDHQTGGVVTQPITVTIHGTNDAPVIKLDGTYSLDQFITQDYGAWIEQGNNSNGAVNGSPFNGEFQLVHDPATAGGDFQIRLTDLDAESDVPDTLTRTFNLVNAGTTAKVEFDYRRDIPSGQTDDKFDVLVSINGGAFISIGNIGATGNGSFVDGSYLHFSFDISSPVTINSVAVQFSVGDNVDDGDIVYVDNVKLSYATPAGSTQTINYAENSAVGILPPQITDADHNATIQSATLHLTNHQANDLLSVTGNLPGTIHASAYDASTGVLTLTGTASLADYQTALSHIIFSNTSDNPDTTDRTLTVTVNDGLADSNVATETIHVTAIDDLPFATADNVITNFGTGTPFQIPTWALLANDQDLDNPLSITGVSGSGGTHAWQWRRYIQRFSSERRLVQLHRHWWFFDHDRPGDDHAGYQRPHGWHRGRRHPHCQAQHRRHNEWWFWQRRPDRKHRLPDHEWRPRQRYFRVQDHRRLHAGSL